MVLFVGHGQTVRLIWVSTVWQCLLIECSIKNPLKQKLTGPIDKSGEIPSGLNGLNGLKFIDHSLESASYLSQISSAWYSLTFRLL